jgi:hypothetical protein
MKLKFFVCIFLILFVSISIASAQSNSLFDNSTGLPVGIEEQISSQIVPNVPAPGEQVNISIDSFSTDLNKANITWTQDGAVLQRGRGIRSIRVFAPKSGVSTVIKVSIDKEKGGTIGKSFVIAPAEVDIIYEAQTYTPPYYKGKALFTSEAEVRFIAMPSFVTSGGSRINPNNLNYIWSVNGSVIQGASGFGRRVLELKGGIVQRESRVSVEVSALNSNLKARDEIRLDDRRPEVLFYENNPLLGIVFEKATVGNFTLKRPEIELQAIPYFFSSPQKENGFLNYKWKVNGDLVEEGSSNSFVRFRNESGQAGKSLISVEIEHLLNILQAGKSNIDLNFEEHEETTPNEFDF